MTVWVIAAGVLMIGGLVPAMVLAYRSAAPSSRARSIPARQAVTLSV
ncbi:MAG TPA: hypothetical protein VF892_08390 [Pseudonocardiaceae bacterium]|nr:hypothetical protein [Pseudonocardiaceae bacterium]